jgi:hypothetical protein
MGASADKSLPPRLLDKIQAAAYLGGVSVDQVERLINAGAVSVVKLPAGRARGEGASCRRVLLDRLELDSLVERSRERRGDVFNESSAGRRSA